VAGHAKIGAGARIGAQSGVFGDVPEGADFLGHPARPRRDTLRTIALTRRLPDLVARIEELEERLRRLEGE
jgi:UDP-3-O-[3-hydroxymyristoyl] glucosamine N-acyltransferase